MIPQSTLKPQETIEKLIEWGGGFCLVQRNGKAPIGRGWQQKGVALPALFNHIAGGGSAGLLGGSLSSGLVIWDLDQGYQAWAEQFPHLATSPTVIRRNAPDKGKVILRVRDRIPTSRAVKAEDGKGNMSEMLAGGKQGVVVGVHPSGVRYEMTAGELVTVSFDELAGAWLEWTGAELLPVGAERPSLASGGGTVATVATSADRPTTRQPGGGDDDLKEQVRAAWPSALDVFKHFGRVGEIQQEADGRLRLLKNGGLLVHDPAGPAPWLWKCFSDGQGGDVFDAWAYCTTGARLERTDKKLFRVVLVDMAKAAGIAVPPARPDQEMVVNPETGEMMAISDFLARARELAGGGIDWHYETASGARRSDPSALKAFVAALAIMGKGGSLEAALSTRHIATAAGMGNKTAGDALKRLVESYGLLERVRMGSAYVASVYRPSGDFVASVWSHSTTLQFNTYGTAPVVGSPPPPGKPLCVELQTSSVDAQTISDYGDHDAFLRTSTPRTGDAAGMKGFKMRRGDTVREVLVEIRDREIGSGARSGDRELGPSALLVVAALVVTDGQNVGELAESTGMCASTVSRILGSLAENGLIELERGRSLVASLRDDWRAILDRVTKGLRTFLLSKARKLAVVRSRMRHFELMLRWMNPNHILRDVVIGIYERAKLWRRALEQAVAA